MADETFAQYESRIARFQRELEDQWAVSTATKMGVRAKELAARAASADLGGDPKFSGWAPTLDTRFDHVKGRPGVISFHPSKQAAGPWTVAQFGRGQAEGPRMVGPRLTKTGRVSKARQKRYNGRTKGKDTADDALKLIEADMPRVVDREVGRAIRKFFN